MPYSFLKAKYVQSNTQFLPMTERPVNKCGRVNPEFTNLIQQLQGSWSKYLDLLMLLADDSTGGPQCRHGRGNKKRW